ncbi:uncharacterized protein LOC133300322, partial [Gastrolobium bilobum]|uniref:uncharacterized protein LOC133300322 n=1 Tax=Gastrolobium bilobum TaxID=150636 RepID=UPI002AB114ED
KKSPAKPPPRKGKRSSQRIKRVLNSNRPERASSAKPITLTDKEEESEDNEPLAKRLKAGRMSATKPAAKEMSPSSSDSTFSDIPSPPPAHSPPQQITPQPSPRKQQGEGQKDKEAASATETSVAEQEDEALARALAEEKGMAIPPLMKEQAATMPSSSRPQVDEPSTAPVVPSAVGNSQQKKQPTSSPTAAIPIAARRKSQIGIAEIFEMLGEKLEK